MAKKNQTKKTPPTAEELRRRFGERLRELREAAGLTQIDLSYAVGITQSGISKIERGATSPTLDVILRLAGACGVTIASMTDGIDDTR
jgi:transcriptional regulator with XRE-family HTH domain